MGGRGDRLSNFFCAKALQRTLRRQMGNIFMIGWTKRQPNIIVHNLLHHKVHDIFEIDYKLKTRFMQKMHEEIWNSFLMSK
jgi:hypothetical protein